MQRGVLSFVAAGLIGVGSLAFVGCADNGQSSNNNQLPPGESGGTAGGNGDFGTNPQRADQHGTVDPNNNNGNGSSSGEK